MQKYKCLWEQSVNKLIIGYLFPPFKKEAEMIWGGGGGGEAWFCTGRSVLFAVLRVWEIWSLKVAYVS